MKICSVGAGKTDGRTDRHNEAKSLFIILRTRLNTSISGFNKVANFRIAVYKLVYFWSTCNNWVSLSFLWFLLSSYD